MSCHGLHLGFDRTGNSAVRSADPGNPMHTVEPNMKWSGPVAKFDITTRCIRDPYLGEGEVVGGSSIVSYWLSCDHYAISNSDHSAAICHRMFATLKLTGVCHFGSKFWGVPFRICPWCWGPQRADIPVKLFLKNSNRCDDDTLTSRTDRQLAVAIGEIAYKRCRLKLMERNKHKNATVYKNFATINERVLNTAAQ